MSGKDTVCRKCGMLVQPNDAEVDPLYSVRWLHKWCADPNPMLMAPAPEENEKLTAWVKASKEWENA